MAGVAALLFTLGVARAEEPTATVRVTAAPITETQEKAPTSFATVIDPAQHAEQVETVTDALAETVGVQVRRFGGLGAFSTISIRGSAPSQTQVYLDGIPLSRAQNETVNLADLPLDALDRIEVYRGTVPVSFGTGAIGGVVNLVTKPPSATPASEASVSYGSFDTRKVVASHTREIGGVDVLAHVTYLGSNGDFEFLDDRGTEQNPADDRLATRQNNAFDSVDGLLKAGYSLADGLRLEWTSETFYKDQGVPNVGNAQSQDASGSDLRALNSARLSSVGLLDGRVDASGTLYAVYQREIFTDAKGELFGFPNGTNNQNTQFGGNSTGTVFAAANNAVQWFTELSHERFEPSIELPRPSPQPDQTRLHLALALQDQADLLDDWLLVVPTVRYEHLRDRTNETFSATQQAVGPKQTVDRDLWSPAIGAQVRPWSWLALKGNLGHYERAPNFNELFGNQGFTRGNAALKPEEGTNRDVGFVLDGPPGLALDRLHFEYAYFNNDVDELIVLVPNSQQVFIAQNIGGARLRGHEVTLSAAALRHLRLDLNWTRQDTEDRGDDPTHRGKQLPGRPEDELYTRIEAFNPLAKVYYEFNYISGNFLDQANFQPVPSRDIHTLGIGVYPLERLAVNFEARNITDNQIRDVFRFPLPGRAFFGTVTVKF